MWILGATERAFPPPVRQDPILLDDERETISERAPAPLAPRSARGSEEALIFALACEAARERLVVSYARRATGESRPRLPSVFFRELASQLEGERVSADDAPLLQRDDVERIPGDAIGAPIRPGHAHDPAAVSAAAAERGVRARARPHLSAGARHAAARGRDVRARAAVVRPRARGGPRTCSPIATRPGTARSDRTRWTRSPTLMPADAPLSADLAGGLCDLSAAVHARAAAARQGGRGARAGRADRRAQHAAA